MRSLLFLATLLSTAVPLVFVRTHAAPSSDSCAAPATGQYLIVSQGMRGEQPLGRLQLETWSPDGSVSGTRFLRVGRTYSETSYQGRWASDSSCGLTVTRAELDDGRPGLIRATPLTWDRILPVAVNEAHWLSAG